jgi:hypothetical protein
MRKEVTEVKDRDIMKEVERESIRTRDTEKGSIRAKDTIRDMEREVTSKALGSTPVSSSSDRLVGENKWNMEYHLQVDRNNLPCSYGVV